MKKAQCNHHSSTRTIPGRPLASSSLITSGPQTGAQRRQWCWGPTCPAAPTGPWSGKASFPSLSLAARSLGASVDWWEWTVPTKKKLFLWQIWWVCEGQSPKAILLKTIHYSYLSILPTTLRSCCAYSFIVFSHCDTFNVVKCSST